jgi:hypothetical protein
MRNFLLYTVIFVACCFDVSEFVTGEIGTKTYSIVSLPIVGKYHFYLLSLIPICFFVLKNKKWIKKTRQSYSNLYRLILFVISMIIIGCVMGSISIISNDNNILRINYLRYFIIDLFTFVIPCLYILYIIYQLITDSEFCFRLISTLTSLIASLIIASLISISLGLRGAYGTSEIILMPLSLFYSVSVIIFIVFKKYNKKFIFIIILATISLFIQFSYPNALTGKSWLMVLLILLSFSLISLKNNKIIALCFGISVILILPIILKTIENKQLSSELSGNKLTQAIMLLSINDLNFWYNNLPNSPKVRIVEFSNIGIEFLQKPSYFLLGKGFSGSTQDHLNDLGTFNRFAFSDDQYANNSFVVLHETINVLFLKFGLFGLWFFGWIFIGSIKNITHNPWITIGFSWFIFFWNYSLSLAFIGLPSLVLGFFLIDKRNIDYGE